MIRGAWMYRREDDAALKICCAPKQNDKPCADSERAQKWRMSLASLLFFTVLLSDHLWLCAGVKLWSKERNYRKTWSNATDGDHPAQGEKCGIFQSNLTKSAAPSPHCTDAQSEQHLESACSTLHRQRTGLGSTFSTPSLSTQLILTYFRNFSLSFCDSYSVSDLLLGMANPDNLNCSLQNMIWDLGSGTVEDEDVCSTCIQAYMRLDQHAQEKYEEFDSLFLKYLSEDYSVKSSTEDCKTSTLLDGTSCHLATLPLLLILDQYHYTAQQNPNQPNFPLNRSVYKAWICSEYFNATQSQCQYRIPCKQYCLEVQTRCPFVLPDNDDLVYGGLSSFICTGLLENHLTNVEPECCDVRWSSCEPASDGACNASSTKPPGSSAAWPVSAASRLCGGSSRLKLCVLVLILLHTVVTFSTVQNSGGMTLETIAPMEEASTREE